MSLRLCQLTILALLVSFGLPAVLGFGLHLVSGLHASDGQSAAYCDCCHARRDTHEERIRSDGNCAICEFLALSKTAEQRVSAEASFEPMSVIRIASATSFDVAEIFHPAAPRAPPV